MKEWFKARNIWGAAIEALTDEEAGRFVKALWAYTMNGEKAELTGAAAGVFAIAVMQLDMDEEQIEAISRKRAEAGASGGKARATNQANALFAKECEANQANALFAKEGEANQANADNKNKNKNKNKEKENSSIGRFTPPTIEQVTEYCRENRISIPVTRWFNYYTANGWKVGKNPMKDWKAAVRTWERNERDGQYGSPGGVSDGKVRSAYSFLDEQSGAV